MTLRNLSFLTDKVKFHWKTQKGNYLLLFCSLFLVLFVLELLVRLEVIDRFYRPRSYEMNNLEFKAKVALNSDFFRDEEFQKEKKAGIYRILLIGDSFVFGTGVDEYETIDKYLEKNLNPEGSPLYEVYSIGKPGASPYDYFEMAKKFKNYQPDLVILSFYVGNDVWTYHWKNSLRLGRLVQEVRDRFDFILWQKGLSDCVFSWIKGFEIDPYFQEKFCRGEINPWLLFALEKPELHQVFQNNLETFSRSPDTKEKVLAIRDLFPQTPFWLLLQPSKHQVTSRSFEILRKIGFKIDSDQVVDRKIQDALIGWAQDHQIETVDVLAMMKGAENSGFFYLIDDHLNPAGNRFVADLLYQKILQTMAFSNKF